MRKLIIMLSLIFLLILGGCATKAKPNLQGSYQSEHINGYTILMTFQEVEGNFVEYIDCREVDRGTYEKTKDNVFKIKSDKQNFEITLNDENSFEIFIKKINKGNAIKLKNISAIPGYFSNKYGDEDKYQDLLN